MLCARGRHAPQRESLAFLVRLHSWCGWRRWKWERKGWNGVGLQLTRPTVLLNEIIAFGWHLFTNSCTQNLLAQRASGESVFGCPTENLLVPGNQMGGNFEPCVFTTWISTPVLRTVNSRLIETTVSIWQMRRREKTLVWHLTSQHVTASYYTSSKSIKNCEKIRLQKVSLSCTPVILNEGERSSLNETGSWTSK